MDPCTDCWFELYLLEWVSCFLDAQSPENVVQKGIQVELSQLQRYFYHRLYVKVYDYVLYNRLVQWFKPDKELAGAQPKRGGVEHIVTLRLIMDFCFRRKKKLSIAYVDFF